MFIYSNKIVQFIDDIKTSIRNIISKEIRLKLNGNRFYDRKETTSYPIKIVIYNNKSMLGYFDPEFCELGFHECLMYSSREQLQNLIRHELAHYITWINYPGIARPHGQEFREFCQRMGWGKEIYEATTQLDNNSNSAEYEESTVLRKIRKLMALSTSSNQNESEQAMIKSQQLLLKHHIDSRYIESKEEEKTFRKRILKQKKENAKMRSIAHILETFFITGIYSRGDNHIYLEIIGSQVNIEIAEYVANFLETELDKLWFQAQKQANLKGMVAKNSFFLGIAKGYCDKIQALKREYTHEIQKAVTVIEKQLVDAKSMIYDRLSSVKRGGNHCHESSALGKQMGGQMSINPALSQAAKNSNLLLG